MLLLVIFQDILPKINILNNQLQEIKATLGKSVNLIYSIIKYFGNDHCSRKFKSVWTDVVKFAIE